MTDRVSQRPSAPPHVAIFAVDDLPIEEPLAWRDAVASALAAGARPLTMYGRAAESDPTAVVVTAVLEDRDGDVSVLRAVMDPEVGYAALTPEVAALHCFERELHEQHGVRIAGHPWLKPIRFERTGAAGRDAYAFYEIKGKEVHEVAVGPIHAGVIEPGSFRFSCLGEVVHHLEIHLGYQHRGVEKLLLARDPRTLAPLVETIAGDTSIGHTWAYAAAIEALAGLSMSAELEAARGVMLELERVAMHLAGLSGMAADVGFLQGATTYGRLRTTAINTSMRLCGSRFGRGAIRPAGLGAKLEARQSLREVAEGGFTLAELRGNLALLTEDLAIINACFLDAETVRHRLKGVGIVTAATAAQIGLVGMAARASGVLLDRRTKAGGVYREHRVEPCVEASGDCWARTHLRIAEIDRSLAWLNAVTEAHPSWQPVRSAVGALAPRQLAIATVEGWRGEVVHALETGREGGLLHYKVQDPSLRNWLGLALAVRDNEISDFPICNKSFDLSYCGNDL
jgi:Ni,Fe-hydrogenase III large subunit